MIIKEINQVEFDSFFPRLMAEHFADTLSYSVFNVRTQTEIDELPNLMNKFRNRESLYLGVYDEAGNLAGWSGSFQTKTYELYTMNSVVLPEHRRKGLYTRLTKEVIRIATERGYQMVTSHHVTSNNSVIVAKLKMDFNITGFEVTDDFGSLVKMTYYINETRKKVFNVRTGYIRPDAQVKELLKIT